MNRFSIRFFALLFFVLSSCLYGATADLIIFSYDRPLQLYSLLESVEQYMSGLSSIHVIYRASNDAFAQAYDHVHEQFDYAYLYRQSDNPQADFKPLTLQATFGEKSRSEYVIFAVDDIIVKDMVDCSHAIDALEKYNAYAFYLRLGTHLTECYSLSCKQPLPPLREVSDGVFAWQFNQGIGDWGYPHSVDMTIIRKRDIEHLFSAMHYTSPNRLEAFWAGNAGPIMERIGLCYADTGIVNIPLNRVQHDYYNRSMEAYTPQELLDIFNDGYKIDITQLYRVKNPSAHTPYELTFVRR